MSHRPCHGMTKAGRACKAAPLKGKDFCRRHLPAEAADTSDTSTQARDERWDRDGFLACFEYTARVTEACRMMGVSRSTVYLEKQRNEEFAVAWSDAEERITESLEAEAIRRARDGTVEPVVSAGKHVADVRRFSDTLMVTLLKARKPERYRDNVKVEHAGSVEQKHRIDLSRLDEGDLDALETIAGKLEAE